MNDAPPSPGPGTSVLATYHLMLRPSGSADFRRAGAVRLATQPPRGAIIQVDFEGSKRQGVVEAVFIPPGCEENCVGTIFLAEA